MSANLNITQWVEAQVHPEVTMNNAIAALDAALTETFEADLTSGNVNVTAAQYRAAMRIFASNVATSGRTVTLPAVKRLVILECESTNTDDISLIRGSTTLTFAPGEVAIVVTDGTTNGLTATVVSGSTSVVPPGGAEGDVLTKQSGADGDYDWEAFSGAVPNGGDEDWVLTKQSGADGDYDWAPAAGGGGGGQWSIPDFMSSFDTGGFATYCTYVLLKEDITVDKLLCSYNNQTIGNIYNMFIATLNSSGDITGTVVTATPFTTVATGLQTSIHDCTPTTLTAGTRYGICMVLTNQTSSTSARATGAITAGFGNAPMDIGGMIADGFAAASSARTWYVSNSDAPTSVSKSGSNTGNYGIGMHWSQ
jgi:hypothetical protein